MPGRLIAFRADRLGARLVSLMNAMRLAQDHNADFACAWTDSAGVGQVFNDPTELFKPGFVKRHFLDADAWRAHRPDCEPLTGQLQQAPSAVTEALATGQDLIVGNAFGIIVLAGEDRDEVSARFRAQFARLPFVPAVAAAMQAVAGALENFTAYHIRRGDLTGDLKAMNKPWPHKMVPNEFYEVHIRHTLDAGTGGVALFSDDPATIAHYKSLFPTLTTLSDLIDTAALTDAQRDLIELYAMSRCATIIAPQRSAFSSTAADLSGAVKVDVTECLSDEDREAAQQALFERLRDRPETFGGPGEIGQCLAHIGQWLEDAKRWDDAARLFAARVADGLNISFIYPQTMGYQHRIDDAAGVIETAHQMRARAVVHVKDQAAAEILHGYAHLRRSAETVPPAPDDAAAAEARETGLRHIVNGFWHSPSIPAARSVVPFLVENELLNHRNFLPSTPLTRGLMPRRGPLKAMFVDFPALVKLPGMAVPHAVGSMEPVLWDWAPLMRSMSISAEVRRGTVARFAEALAALPDKPESAPERASLLALWQAFDDRTEAAAGQLRALVRQVPGDAMIWQRLSHVLRIARDYAGSADAAEQAALLVPDWPLMRAWAGMAQLRARQFEPAAEHLHAAAQKRPGIPSVHALLSEVLQRLGDQDGALAHIRTALDLAPLEVEYSLRIARILDQAGQPAEAAGHLIPVVEAERAPAKLFILLIELLEKTGETSEAAEIAREAHRRRPDHPAIADLAERLAA